MRRALKHRREYDQRNMEPIYLGGHRYLGQSMISGNDKQGIAISGKFRIHLEKETQRLIRIHYCGIYFFVCAMEFLLRLIKTQPVHSLLKELNIFLLIEIGI